MPPEYLCSIVVAFALLLRAEAYHQCTKCIPLEHLLSEAYGIEVAADGLHSAVAFHNGTVEYVAYSPGTIEYQSMMQSILDNEIGHSSQRRRVCRRPGTRPPPLPFDESFLSFLVALFSLPKVFWDKYIRQTVIQEPHVPVSPAVRLFKTQMEALPPFANMSAEQKSHVSVIVSVPAWLIGTEEDCQVTEAAGKTFGKVFYPKNPSSSAYTALGYELCGKSYEAFDCTGPGRIMTIEFLSDHLIIMSLVRTPLIDWSLSPVAFSVSRESNEDTLVEWINSFVDTQKPDMVITVGPDAHVPHLRNAVLRSRAASHLIDQSAIAGQRAVVMGAARAAKDRLESHSDDCGEDDECIQIREQADRIAGKYKVPQPPTWPAIGREHLHHQEL